MQSATVSPLTGNGQALSLFDDSVVSPRTIVLAPPWMPAPEIQLQTAMPIRARYAKVFARGNALSTYVFKVTRTHSTTAEAEQFKRDHVKALVQACATGQFVLTHSSFGVTMRSVGALKTPRCTEQIGCKTTFSYEWMGTPFE